MRFRLGLMKTRSLLPKLARGISIALFLLSFSSLLPAVQAADTASPSELLEQGIYSEETKGDLDAALKLYQQVVAEAKAGHAVAAQAQYRLGVCYYKKKNYAEANAAFGKLVADYADQKDLVALANKYLAEAMPLMPAPWVDGEELRLDIKFPTGFKIGAAWYRVNAGEVDGRKVWRVASRIFATTQQASRVEVEADSFKPLHCWWKINLLGEVEVNYSPGSAELRTLANGETNKIDLTGGVYDNEEAVQLIRRLPLAPPCAFSPAWAAAISFRWASPSWGRSRWTFPPALSIATRLSSCPSTKPSTIPPMPTITWSSSRPVASPQY